MVESGLIYKLINAALGGANVFVSLVFDREPKAPSIPKMDSDEDSNAPSYPCLILKFVDK